MLEKRQFNEQGYRIGQYHHRAKLTDNDIDHIFQLREDGLTLGKIAELMDCGKTTVWKVLKGSIRGQAIMREDIIKKV